MPKYEVHRQALYFSNKIKNTEKIISFYYSVDNGNTLKVQRTLNKSDVAEFLKCPKKIKCDKVLKKANKTYVLTPETVELKY